MTPAKRQEIEKALAELDAIPVWRLTRTIVVQRDALRMLLRAHPVLEVVK